jgi:carboxyl-terminal processing protease
VFVYRFKSHLVAFVVLLAVAAGIQAKVIPTDPAELIASQDHLRATELIVQFLRRYHYRNRILDDAHSEGILAQYLEALDPNRSYFLMSDIEEIQKFRHQLDDALRDTKINPAFVIFRRLRQRLEQRVAFAIDRLHDGFDFSITEDFMPDRSEAVWAKNETELDEIWRKRVKNDALNLTLAGRDPDEVIEVLQNRYQRLADRIGQFTSDDVYQMFINAYTATIEPHTSYFSKRASDNFKIRMSLSLEGIGAALQTENEYTVVRRVIPGGPADLNGQLAANDRVTGVAQDEEAMVDVVGWRLGDVVDLIRGPKGTVVKLEVLPKGNPPDGASKTITLVRNKIKLEEQAAQSELLKATTGYGVFNIAVIDVPTFYTDFEGRERGDKNFRSTTRDVRKILANLDDEAIDGIIVDLRGNGGGSLAEATELTGLFINSGPIVQVRDSSGRININEDPDPEVSYTGPLAVMVDRNSASASEIFAGAMQDYNRAVIIGEPTFGKGTVQRLVDLNRFAKFDGENLGQLKFTIAQFFRINGESTQHRGVVPDIIFPTAIDTQDQGESSLDYALPWASVRPASYKIGGVNEEILYAAQRNHESRIKDHPGFGYLIGEAEALKNARARDVISLLESERKELRDHRVNGSLERLNRYRKSQGLRELEDFDDQDDDEDRGPSDNTDTDNILRGEASRILADIIALSRDERLITQAEASMK